MPTFGLRMITVRHWQLHLRTVQCDLLRGCSVRPLSPLRLIWKTWTSALKMPKIMQILYASLVPERWKLPIRVLISDKRRVFKLWNSRCRKAWSRLMNFNLSCSRQLVILNKLAREEFHNLTASFLSFHRALRTRQSIWFKQQKVSVRIRKWKEWLQSCRRFVGCDQEAKVCQSLQEKEDTRAYQIQIGSRAKSLTAAAVIVLALVIAVYRKRAWEVEAIASLRREGNWVARKVAEVAEVARNLDWNQDRKASLSGNSSQKSLRDRCQNQPNQ